MLTLPSLFTVVPTKIGVPTNLIPIGSLVLSTVFRSYSDPLALVPGWSFSVVVLLLFVFDVFYDLTYAHSLVHAHIAAPVLAYLPI